MTKVGKVELDAVIDGHDLKRQLTKDIHEAVLPQLREMNKQIREINKDIGQVKSKPYTELAKEAGVVADQHQKIARAIKVEENAQLRLDRATEHARKTSRAALDARREYRRELELTGKVEEKTARKAQDSTNAAILAIRTRTQREKEYAEASKKVDRERANDRRLVSQQVRAHVNQEIAGFEQLKESTQKATRQIIADAIKRTNAEIAEEVRHREAVEDELAKEEAARDKSRRVRERAESAAGRRREDALHAEAVARNKAIDEREKAEDRARIKRERAEAKETARRKEMARRGFTSPGNIVASLGREAFGLNPKFSSTALMALGEGAIFLAGAAASAAQSIWLLPAATAAAGAGIGTLVLAFNGFGDVLKAMMDGDVEKFAETINKLSPSAQQLALELKALGPLFSEVQTSAQDAMFAGSDEMVKGLVAQYQPMIKGLTTSISSSFNGMFGELTKTLLSPDVAVQMQKISDNIAAAFAQLVPLIEPMTQAFTDIMEVGSEFLPGLSRGAVGLAEGFRDFIREAKESGKLKEWLGEGLKSLALVAKVVWEIGRAFMSLAPVGEKYLPTVVNALASIADWLNHHPTALFDALKFLIAAKVIGALFTLTKNLGFVAMAFGTTLPGAIAKTGGALERFWAATGTWAKGGSFTTAIRSAEADIDRVSGKAAAATRNIRGIGLSRGAAGGIAGLAATVGAGFLIDDILDKNSQSSAALMGYRDAVTSARDAQVLLNNALIASKGAWDGAAQAAGTNRLSQVLKTFEAGSNSAASWLDGLRKPDGNGFSFTSLFGNPITGEVKNRKTVLDAQAADNKEAADALKSMFGESLTGLDKIMTGPRDVFDSMVKTLADMGKGGVTAANELVKVRDEIMASADAAAKAGPILEKLGPDTAASALQIKTAFSAIPKDVPVSVKVAGGETVEKVLRGLGVQVDELSDGTIKIAAPVPPEVTSALKALGIELDQLKDGTIKIKLDGVDAAKTEIKGLSDDLKGLVVPGLIPGVAPKTTIPGMPSVNGQLLAPGIGGAAAGLPGIPGIPVPAVTPPPPKADVSAPKPELPKDPVNPATGKPYTDKEYKDLLASQLDPAQWKVDPWGPQTGAPKVLGDGSLQVSIPGLNPNALGVPGIPGVTGTAGSALWDKIAQAESSGRWQDNNSGNNSTSSGAPRGGLQITDGTWAAFGGTEFAPTANLATKEQQIEVAQRIAFSGYKGTAPQGLGAWETVTKGMVPGVTVNSKPGDFGGALAMPPSVLPQGGLPRQYEPGMVPNNVNLLSVIEQMFPGVTAHADVARNDKYGEHGSGEALDIMVGANKALGDQINQFLLQNANALGLQYDLWQQTQWNPDGSTSPMEDRHSPTQNHMDHVHARVRGGQAAGGALRPAQQAMLGQIPQKSLSDNMYAQNGPLQQDPVTGELGYFQIDTQAVQNAGDQLGRAAHQLEEANKDYLVILQLQKENKASEQDVLDAREKQLEAQQNLTKSQQDLAEKQQGNFKNYQPPDYSKLPFGDPRRILAGAITGAGGTAEDAAALIGGALGGVGADITRGVGSAIGFDVRQGPASSYTDLIRQRNPLAPLAMAGYQVPDYSVAGGGPEAQNLTANVGPMVTANGQMFSDTAGLLDRSFTNLQAAIEAKLDQVESVLNQVKDQLVGDVLAPVVEQGVTSAFQSAGQELGTAIGESAGPIIAQAVANAVPKGNGNGAAGSVVTDVGNAVLPSGGQPTGMAIGGPVYGGIPGRDSVHALLTPNEHVFTTDDVAAMGGHANVYAFRAALHRNGGLRGFATGGAVIGNDTVGADFFGVSQVPVIGMIVNLLVRVLLKVLGVEIKVRDTLDEMSKDFREFRGDFKAFDASGRLMNDTSALLDRSSTSEQTAADERVRILKIVIEALIKYIIEKLVVPIGKAIANSMINAGAGAAGGAIGGAFPGGGIVGGAVSSVISTAGSAVVDIVAEIFTDFSLALTNVLTDMIAEMLQGMFPGLMTDIFGGAGLAALFDPITAIVTGMFAPLLGLLGGLGSISLPGLPFDSGGVAPGIGFMPKATIRPERVLSPQQTASFDRLVSALDSGRISTGGRTTTVHAPITVLGGAEAGRNVQNSLLALID